MRLYSGASRRRQRSIWWLCHWLEITIDGHLQGQKFTRSNSHSSYFCVTQYATRNVKICTMQNFPLYGTVADLGLLKGGFRFRRITVIARIVTSWQARRYYMSMQRLRYRRPPVQSTEIFRNLDHFCWLFRYHIASIGPVVVGAAASVPPPLWGW